LAGQSRQHSKDLWRPLEQTALEGLRAGKGVMTIDPTDRSQRNLFLSLERLVGNGTVTRVRADSPYATYLLREPEGVREAEGEAGKGEPDGKTV
jgi:hypothetical protein